MERYFRDNKILFWILVGIAFLVLIYFLFTKSGDEGKKADKTSPPKTVMQALLSDVSGGAGSGMANKTLDQGFFINTVNAKLPKPPQGFFYEGWLARGKPGDADFNIFPTGKLKLVAAEGPFWILFFRDKVDRSDHYNVVITLEKEDDTKPEKHILEGNF